jgi:hypothetical protein
MQFLAGTVTLFNTFHTNLEEIFVVENIFDQAKSAEGQQKCFMSSKLMSSHKLLRF